MNKRIFKSFSLVSAMTMLSRVMGFARDMVLAYFFGAGAAMDAFLVAFKIPNFMRSLFAEGAFSQAFVPVLSEYREKKDPEKVQHFIFAMFTALGLALVGVLLVFELAAPLVVTIFAPGFSENIAQFNLAVDLLRICLPYLLLICITAFFGSVLNCWNRFGVPSFTPVLLNVSLITAAFLSVRFFEVPIKALAWGVFGAGVIQLLFQLLPLYHLGMFPRFRSFWGNAGVTKVLKLMAPALLGVSVVQISLLIATLFASFLPSGSITWLYYSERLAYFPLGVFGVALSTVIMPHLSSAHAKETYDDFSKTLNKALKMMLMIGLPSAVGLFVLSGPLLAALFEGGHFSAEDVLMAEKSLKALALGLPAFMCVKVLISSFYARQDIKTPVRIAIVALIVNIIMSAILIFPLKHAGLALSTSLSSWLNAGLLLFNLYRLSVYKPAAYRPGFMLGLLSSNVLMAILLIFGAPSTGTWLEWSKSFKVLMLFVWIVLAMGIYGGALKTFSFFSKLQKNRKNLTDPN